MEPAVRRMMAAMTHRGPDDEGFESLPLGAQPRETIAAFGFRRLAILDLSPAGHQPMVHLGTGDCLVFNGEIYNFRHLRSRLMAEGVRFTSSGDSEVLLAALVKWGELALDEVEGMFALAFFHAASRRVLLARDPVGIKPLYVSANAERLVFASEIRALLASGLVAADLDAAGVAGFLTYGAPQDPLTVHRHIRSFPCGTRQWIGIDSKTSTLVAAPSERFWRFPDNEEIFLDEATATRGVRQALENAVASHLASDVRAGFFLSGGVDSTAIAALAARSVGRIRTYSVGFDSPSMPSELGFAKETATRLGSDHTEILIQASSIRDWWDSWLAAADRPSVDGLNTFIISGAVKRAAATVAFSGLGADELFGGYANFRRVRYLTPLLQAASAFPSPVRRVLGTALSAVFPPRYRARIKSLAETAGRPGDIGIELKRFLSTATVAELGLDPVTLGLRPNFLPAQALADLDTRSRDPFVVVSRIETYLYMGNTLLRDTDVNSMAHSLEIRVPFLAKPVLEIVGRIPGRIHMRTRTPGKYLVRLALADLLPDHVLNRVKTGFTLPINDWLFSELRDSSEAAVAALDAVPFLDPQATRRLWKSFQSNRQHTYWMKPMLLIALGSYISRLNKTTGIAA
jgi:asparagine synthase (glutamine-hydrolysing)